MGQRYRVTKVVVDVVGAGQQVRIDRPRGAIVDALHDVRGTVAGHRSRSAGSLGWRTNHEPICIITIKHSNGRTKLRAYRRSWSGDTCCNIPKTFKAGEHQCTSCVDSALNVIVLRTSNDDVAVHGKLGASLIIGASVFVFQLLRKFVEAFAAAFKNIDGAGVGTSRERAARGDGAIINGDCKSELVDRLEFVRRKHLRWSTSQ